MAVPSSPTIARLQYLMARFASSQVLAVDVDTAMGVATTVARNLARLDKRHWRRTQEHLQRAFPEWSQEQRDITTELAFEHLAQLAIEVLHVPRLIHPSSWERHVDISGLTAEAVQLLNAREPAVMITGHHGNWELLGYTLATLGYGFDVVARPLDNPLIYEWLLGIRQKRGLRILDKVQASYKAQDILNNGGVVAFTADQNGGGKGCFVPFCGHLASCYKSIALLAITHNVPLVCGFSTRCKPSAMHGRFRHKIEVNDIIYPKDWLEHEDPVFYVTARWSHAVERAVRACPEQYLWMHRRWKSRPRFMLQGKKPPASLRRKLESLPFLETDYIERVLDNAQRESAEIESLNRKGMS